MKIQMIQAFDHNKIPFTAFILCNAEEREEIREASKNNTPLNLTKFNIIYQMLGHDVSQKITNDVLVYCQYKFPHLNLLGDIDTEQVLPSEDDLSSSDNGGEKSIQMIQGFDRNQTPFTLFALCDPEEIKKINETKNGGLPLNLEKFNIIFKMLSHEVNQKIIDDVLQYCNYKFPHLNLLGDIDTEQVPASEDDSSSSDLI